MAVHEHKSIRCKKHASSTINAPTKFYDDKIRQSVTQPANSDWGSQISGRANPADTPTHEQGLSDKSKEQVYYNRLLISQQYVLSNIQETNQEMRYPNVNPLPFNAPTIYDLRKILHGGRRISKVQNDEEILPEVSTPE